MVQTPARAIATERRSSGARDHSCKERREDGSSTHVYVVSPSLLAVDEEPTVVTRVDTHHLKRLGYAPRMVKAACLAHPHLQ